MPDLARLAAHERLKRELADTQLARYHKFVIGIQNELPGWRPETWTKKDEDLAFPRKAIDVRRDGR